MAIVVNQVIGNAGSISGGNSVVLIGSGFVAITSVLFGDVPAIFVVNSATKITIASAPVADVPNNSVVNIVVSDGTLFSQVDVHSQYFYVPPISSPNYINNNIFFDPNANYTVFGHWTFAQSPIFPNPTVLPEVQLAAVGSSPGDTVAVTWSPSTGLFYHA